MMRKPVPTPPPAAVSFLNHPAFQSLVLPLLLAAAATLLLRAAGPRWAALGAALGLVLALAAWPGFDWPASSQVQKLPWATLVGLLLAGLAMALKTPGSKAMGRQSGLLATALLTLAALALTAWAAFGGSLLLAQLALMLGAVAGVAGLWSWRSASISPAALLPLVLTGVGIALALAWLPAGDVGDTPADNPYYTPKWQ